MSVLERAPSIEWTPVTLHGETIAEAWFEPEGEPRTFAFRIPRSRFDADDMTLLPTVEDLLIATGIAVGEVESWRFLDEFHSSKEADEFELKRLLPSPVLDDPHLIVHVRLKSMEATSGTLDVSPETFQALDAVWKTILGLEVSTDALRMSMDGLRMEMENAFKKSLNVDEKVNASQADVAQWTKAKNRVHYALPKVREFIHRATWAAASEERKRLAEIVTKHIEPQVPFAEIDSVRERLGHLQKDRQILYGTGNAVNQECRGILSEIQRAISTLQRNAMDTARKKRSQGREKGKHL